MNWEKLRPDQMPEAIERSGGLCILPLGCTEKHGAHLPLGTDSFEVRHHAEQAAALEEAVIFPVAPWLGV
ncbi:MAG: creatininase family protein [Clostridia bacterium]|nr:creatininase family protein [Clostridia bacterium]